jgi:hypothetical protein
MRTSELADPGRGVGTDFSVRAAELSALLGTAQLPDPGEWGWLSDLTALAVWSWAANNGAYGPVVAVDVAEYVLRRGAAIQRGGPDAAVVVLARMGKSIGEWRQGASTHRTRHELLVGDVYDRVEDDHRPAPSYDPDAPVVSDYLAEAIGRQLALDAAGTLDDCALIAADRCWALRRLGRAHPLRDLSSCGPRTGRLAPLLVKEVPDLRARRSTVRRLVGTGRLPQAALLYQRARGARPLQVPIAIRASWAADALDLDRSAWPANSRGWARRLARRAVLPVPPTDLSTPVGQLAPAV